MRICNRLIEIQFRDTMHVCMYLHPASGTPVCTYRWKYNSTTEQSKHKVVRVLTVSCTIHFRGNLSPVLEISGQAGASESEIPETGIYNTNGVIQTKTFVLENEKQSFYHTCLVTFDQVHWNTSTAGIQANNIPDWRHTEDMEYVVSADDEYDQGKQMFVNLYREML